MGNILGSKENQSENIKKNFTSAFCQSNAIFNGYSPATTIGMSSTTPNMSSSDDKKSLKSLPNITDSAIPMTDLEMINEKGGSNRKRYSKYKMELRNARGGAIDSELNISEESERERINNIFSGDKMVGGANYNSDSDNEIENEDDSNYDTDNHEEFIKISKTLTQNIDTQAGGS
jgi:hypothetical protein